MQSATKKTIRVVAAVIERDGKYLITQRRPSAVLPLLWEFPGGKVESGESDAQALAREMNERLGIRVQVGQLISNVNHNYETYNVELWLYECTCNSDQLSKKAVHDFKWVASADFDQFPFTPADEASMAKLLGLGH